MRTGLLAALGIVLAASPATSVASAAGIVLHVPPSAVAGQPQDLSFDVSANASGPFSVITRPFAGRPCAATEEADPSGDDTLAFSVVSPGATTLSRAGYAWPAAGDEVVCAWLQRASDGATVATAAQHVSVRAPKGSLGIVGARSSVRRLLASVTVQVQGSYELPGAAVDVEALKFPRACPAGPRDVDSDPGTEENHQGPFTALVPVGFYGPGPYRLCAWLLGDRDEVVAQASRRFVRRLFPLNERAPSIRAHFSSLYAHQVRFGQLLTCEPGRWAAYPAARFAYRWFRAGRRIRDHRRTYRLRRSDLRADMVTCGVIARNELGRTKLYLSSYSVTPVSYGPRPRRHGHHRA